jgi:hypothetical protein
MTLEFQLKNNFKNLRKIIKTALKKDTGTGARIIGYAIDEFISLMKDVNDNCKKNNWKTDLSKFLRKEIKKQIN